MSNLEKKHFTSTERETLVSEWHHSGMSKKKFAEQRGLKYCTFVGWFQSAGKEKSGSGFSEIIISGSDKLFMEVVVRDRTLRFYQPLPAEYFVHLLK